MKKTRYLLIVILLISGLSVSGQTLPIVYPTIKTSNVYTKEEQIIWQKAIDQYLKINSGEMDYNDIYAQDRKMVDSLEMGYGPMTNGPGCSWYCAGGPDTVTASSYLKNDEKINYLPDNIHDFHLFTAWVPDTAKGSIGEKVHFHFTPFSPRVNEIIIYNGYIKNTYLWKANARVAKFKLLINGKPIAILALKDVNNAQSFKINPVQSTDSTKDLILTLEILEIYKGAIYKDVVVSEINFNGLDVHCFTAGTQITMADSSTKSIEQIAIDDWVMAFDTATNKLVKAQVSKIIQARHTNLIKLKFSDREVIATDDHPFWTANKNWASVNPAKSNNNYEQSTEVKLLVVGDKIFVASENCFTELIGVEKIEEEQMTFTLELKNGNSFIANGLLVKTEMVKCVN
jgi:hypothetical protein